MRVRSTKSISFPKLRWAISAGGERELPESKEAQARILAEPDITPVEEESKSRRTNLQTN